eukprot:gene4193-6539_t
MGISTSQLDESEVDTYTSSTGFSPRQIQRLYRRFQRLDRDENGFISFEELMSIPELALNPLVERIVQIFDTESSESGSEIQITFEKFLKALSVFQPITDKSKSSSEDTERDGFIDSDELFTVLKMMVTDGISDEQLTFIVDQTIKEADDDGDGRISFDEFCRILEKTDIDHRMTIRF